MIVGFSNHGTGRGSGPTDYLTDERRSGREHAPPVVLRGDADQTSQLIDALDFKHKYTSGVLSFAPEERITPEMEQTIMDRFESMAFAALEPDQYNILWVRHTHAGHHELHFVTPRVELNSGKSLNIKPPGERAKQHFDDFRSEINARYGLADPTDPSRTRNVSTPDHELKIASEAIRNGQRAPDNIREMIDAVLSQRAVQGLINSREDVLEQAKELGLKVTRAGKDYITVSEPQSGHRWRLKGELYARDFKSSRAIEKSDAARERDYSRADPKAAQRYAQRVERHIAARAEYHQSRYPKPEPKHRLEYVQEPLHVADVSRTEPLSRHLRRELGDDALLHQPNHRATTQHQPLGEARRQDSVEQMWRSDLHSGSQGRGKLEEKQRQETHVYTRGLLTDDRTRTTPIERVQKLADSTRETTQRLCSRLQKLGEHVRHYLGRKQADRPATQKLERAGQYLEHSTPAVRKIVQHEQAIRQEHQREISRSRSGPTLGF